jgi:hypothetical protein
MAAAVEGEWVRLLMGGLACWSFRSRLGCDAASARSPGDAADRSAGGVIRSCLPAGEAEEPQLQKVLQTALQRWRRV